MGGVIFPVEELLLSRHFTAEDLGAISFLGHFGGFCGRVSGKRAWIKGLEFIKRATVYFKTVSPFKIDIAIMSKDQVAKLKEMKTLSDYEVFVVPHSRLNTYRGVVSCNLFCSTDKEI